MLIRPLPYYAKYESPHKNFLLFLYDILPGYWITFSSISGAAKDCPPL